MVKKGRGGVLSPKRELHPNKINLGQPQETNKTSYFHFKKINWGLDGVLLSIREAPHDKSTLITL